MKRNPERESFAMQPNASRPAHSIHIRVMFNAVTRYPSPGKGHWPCVLFISKLVLSYYGDTTLSIFCTNIVQTLSQYCQDFVHNLSQWARNGQWACRGHGPRTKLSQKDKCWTNCGKQEVQSLSTFCPVAGWLDCQLVNYQIQYLSKLCPPLFVPILSESDNESRT